MSRHEATIRWERQTESFTYPLYNRDHLWEFGHNLQVKASAAPEFLGSADRVDPEQAFVASVSSCHMLTFLAICARQGIIVERYLDHAVGFLEKNENGRLAISRVELFPAIEFQAGRPSDETLQKLHHLSHEQCFVANSILTEVKIRNI